METVPISSLGAYTLTLDCQEPWYSHIKANRKCVEGRCGKRYKLLNANDVIKLENGDHSDFLLLRVKHIAVYSTFRAMIEAESLADILPGVESVDVGVSIYRQFYPEKAEREHGVVGIHFEIIE